MGDKVEDKAAEVTAAVASGGAEETAEDYDLDTNVTVERGLIPDWSMDDPEVQGIT